MFEYPFEMAGVTATMAIIHHNQGNIYILLGKRKDTSLAFPGEWCLPGGYLNVGKERLVTTARRETKEECGLDIDESRWNFFYLDDEPGSDPRYSQVINMCYSTIVNDDELDLVAARDDIVDIKWVSLNKVPTLAFAHNNIVEELKKYLEAGSINLFSK